MALCMPEKGTKAVKLTPVLRFQDRIVASGNGR